MFGSIALADLGRLIGVVVAAGLLLDARTMATRRSPAARSSACGRCAITCAPCMFARRMMAAATLSDVSYTVSGIVLCRGCRSGSMPTARSVDQRARGACGREPAWRSLVALRCARPRIRVSLPSQRVAALSRASGRTSRGRCSAPRRGTSRARR